MLQYQSTTRGYDKAFEDDMLEASGWEQNGYGLFKISCWAGSCPRGWFGDIAESNCLFLERSLFDELGGFEEAFTSPGGGMVNLDFFRRAMEAENVRPIYILGEGSFHQLHGGVTTGNPADNSSFAALQYRLQDEYRRIRGRDFVKPMLDPLLLGRVHPASLPRIEEVLCNAPPVDITCEADLRDWLENM